MNQKIRTAIAAKLEMAWIVDEHPDGELALVAVTGTHANGTERLRVLVRVYDATRAVAICDEIVSAGGIVSGAILQRYIERRMDEDRRWNAKYSAVYDWTDPLARQTSIAPPHKQDGR